MQRAGVEETTERLPEAALLRFACFHPGSAAASGEGARRKPDYDRHGLRRSVGEGSSGPCAQYTGIEQCGAYGDSRRQCCEADQNAGLMMPTANADETTEKR